VDDERVEEEAIERGDDDPDAAPARAGENGGDAFERVADEDERGYSSDLHLEHEEEPSVGEGDTLEGDAIEPDLAACPTCGEPVERRQLVCLSCGGRVALGDRRLAVPELLVTLLVAVVVVGAALSGFAISELTGGDDGGDGGGAASPASANRARTAETAPEPPAVVAGGGEPQRTETAPRRRNALAWPAGLSAHTVVLVTTGDRAAALAVAKEARSTGLEAGLLPSDPYNLGTGLWIVFSGRFTTREGAARQAAQLADRYPGAYPQLIQRSQ